MTNNRVNAIQARTALLLDLQTAQQTYDDCLRDKPDAEPAPDEQGDASDYGPAGQLCLAARTGHGHVGIPATSASAVTAPASVMGSGEKRWSLHSFTMHEKLGQMIVMQIGKSGVCGGLVQRIPKDPQAVADNRGNADSFYRS